jgi:hypothetical protein
MDKLRYKEMSGPTIEGLTEAEKADGWFYCNYEWDGMLMHSHWKEAEICRENCNCQPLTNSKE